MPTTSLNFTQLVRVPGILEHPDGPAMLAAHRAATDEVRRMRVEAARRYHARTVAPTGTGARHGTIGYYNSGSQYRRYRYPRYRPYFPVVRNYPASWHGYRWWIRYY